MSSGDTASVGVSDLKGPTDEPGVPQDVIKGGGDENEDDANGCLTVEDHDKRDDDVGEIGPVDAEIVPVPADQAGQWQSQDHAHSDDVSCRDEQLDNFDDGGLFAVVESLAETSAELRRHGNTEIAVRLLRSACKLTVDNIESSDGEDDGRVCRLEEEEEEEDEDAEAPPPATALARAAVRLLLCATLSEAGDHVAALLEGKKALMETQAVCQQELLPMGMVGSVAAASAIATQQLRALLNEMAPRLWLLHAVQVLAQGLLVAAVETEFVTGVNVSPGAQQDIGQNAQLPPLRPSPSAERVRPTASRPQASGDFERLFSESALVAQLLTAEHPVRRCVEKSVRSRSERREGLLHDAVSVLSPAAQRNRGWNPLEDLRLKKIPKPLFSRAGDSAAAVQTAVGTQAAKLSDVTRILIGLSPATEDGPGEGDDVVKGVLAPLPPPPPPIETASSSRVIDMPGSISPISKYERWFRALPPERSEIRSYMREKRLNRSLTTCGSEPSFMSFASETSLETSNSKTENPPQSPGALYKSASSQRLDQFLRVPPKCKFSPVSALRRVPVLFTMVGPGGKATWALRREKPIVTSQSGRPTQDVFKAWLATATGPTRSLVAHALESEDGQKYFQRNLRKKSEKFKNFWLREEVDADAMFEDRTRFTRYGIHVFDQHEANRSLKPMEEHERKRKAMRDEKFDRQFSEYGVKPPSRPGSRSDPTSFPLGPPPFSSWPSINSLDELLSESQIRSGLKQREIKPRKKAAPGWEGLRRS
eukprot:TRINITY_DN8617_c4_g1_i1.p1 TRINITY_DN8617_c4_g1~~TRINITY_DN8617_c4_g1_i1.p1  ORF type:complete len:764 (-),score=152.83 TRINITY_DN8617_c4_g1_i1:143-2434(-)